MNKIVHPFLILFLFTSFVIAYTISLSVPTLAELIGYSFQCYYLTSISGSLNKAV